MSVEPIRLFYAGILIQAGLPGDNSILVDGSVRQVPTMHTIIVYACARRCELSPNLIQEPARHACYCHTCVWLGFDTRFSLRK